jgi:hypothetical protein
VTWPKQGNTMRRVKVPAAPNSRYVGLVLLFSTETGEPLAILPDGVMQRMRVGAANGLGIKYLARQNATRVGLLGSGWQAGAQLMAVCAVRKVDSSVASANRDNREIAKDMEAALGVEVIPVEQPEERSAARHCDVRHEFHRSHLLRAVDRAGNAYQLDQTAGDRVKAINAPIAWSFTMARYSAASTGIGAERTKAGPWRRKSISKLPTLPRCPPVGRWPQRGRGR